MDIINLIANEFEMCDFVKECKKLDKINNDEFVKIAKKKLTYDEFKLYKEHCSAISRYWFVRQRELIKFTLKFVNLMQK